MMGRRAWPSRHSARNGNALHIYGPSTKGAFGTGVPCIWVPEDPLKTSFIL